METNSFTFDVAYTNIESKIKINGLLFDPLTPIYVGFPQLISNEVSGSIPNIQWICCHVFESKVLNFSTLTGVFC